MLRLERERNMLKLEMDRQRMQFEEERQAWESQRHQMGADIMNEVYEKLRKDVGGMSAADAAAAPAAAPQHPTAAAAAAAAAAGAHARLPCRRLLGKATRALPAPGHTIGTAP